MDIDVWDVVEAAKSKPFGFMPFYPGPAYGGHCIRVETHFTNLTWKAREHASRPVMNGWRGEYLPCRPRLSPRLMERNEFSGLRMALSAQSYFPVWWSPTKKNIDDVERKPFARSAFRYSTSRRCR